MIKAEDAIAVARSLIGTPYSEMDCINLIKRVIRTSPGGVSDYTTAGTNTLWRSFEASAKYRDLTWRKESIDGAKAGMLAFKRSGNDVHHVGIVTGEGTVIHSSSVRNGVGVVETVLDEDWHLLGVHRYIVPMENDTGETDMMSYTGRVVLARPDERNNHLNVRNEPSTNGKVIGRLGHGARVVVQAEPCEGWVYVSYGDNGVGYVSSKYIEHIEEEPEEKEFSPVTILINDRGETMTLEGVWRVAED